MGLSSTKPSWALQTPLVGRERELATLTAGLDAALAGRGHLYLVSGEPGVGKTRLLEEVAAEATARSAIAVWGRCWEGEDAPPFWPWVRVLRALLAREEGASAARADALAAAQVGRLVSRMAPQLAPSRGAPVQGASAPSLAGEAAGLERFELFDGVARFLKGVAGQRPVVVLLDDVHAMHLPSVVLLQFLARDLRTVPVLVVAAYREAEIHARGTLAERLGDLARESTAIPLRGLDAPAIHALITGLAGRAPSERLVDLLHQATDGNPFFLNETIRLLIAEECFEVGAIEAGRWAIPDRGRSAVRARLALVPERRAVLDVAAVVEPLGAVQGTTTDGVRAALELSQRLASPPFIAMTQQNHAAVLVAHGRPEDLAGAEATFSEALTTGQRLGMRKVAEEAECLRKQLGAAGSSMLATGSDDNDKVHSTETRPTPRSLVRSRDPRAVAYALGGAFAQRPQLDELIPFAVAECREILDAEGVAVLLLDRQRQQLYFPYVAEQDPVIAARLLQARFPVECGLAGAVLRSRTPVRVDDVSTDPRFFPGIDRQTGRTTRALIGAPLVCQEEEIGVLEAVNPCGGGVFSDDDVALLNAIAQSLAEAIAGAADRFETSGRNSGGGDQEIRDQDLEANVFRLDGDFWTIAFGGAVLRLKDSKGLHYLAHLLRHPGQEFHALDLVQSETTDHRPQTTEQRQQARHHEPRLDRQAKAAYKRRLADLREELREAEAFNDVGRADKARAEMEFIAHELSAAVGLGGRDRKTSAPAERARLLVTQRIKATLKKIRGHHPVLGRHLATSVRTGYFCTYTPDPGHPIKWLVGVVLAIVCQLLFDDSMVGLFGLGDW